MDEVVANSVGVSYPAINSSVLINVKIPKPPKDEHEILADFLDHQTRETDTVIEKHNESIKLLKEYRTALISEAVTGKIDVRDEVT